MTSRFETVAGRVKLLLTVSSKFNLRISVWAPKDFVHIQRLHAGFVYPTDPLLPIAQQAINCNRVNSGEF